ncbi:DUF3365 domain-containing protein [Ideonella sp. A 288]|uniref:Tll0287-like domain-containing protein n=1 Tax=Ideonella sp. A 288 TaxID=1962181 RepID=UPI000B4B2573|nr:DUF3365 domain-containing protein [Ideonella sp. A 288]
MTRPVCWAATVAASLALLGCTAPTPAEPPWVAQARGVAAAVPPKLLNVLRDEIDRGGPEGAIEVCREQAPKMAKAASEQSGWSVRRVSLRNRNPKAVPDAWERAALESFDRRAAAREPATQLELADTVQENGQRVQRYIRALPVAELCVSCHGQPQDLKPAVSAKLKALYPDDHGVGYRVGDIRGAITLRRPVP